WSLCSAHAPRACNGRPSQDGTQDTARYHKRADTLTHHRTLRTVRTTRSSAVPEEGIMVAAGRAALDNDRAPCVSNPSAAGMTVTLPSIPTTMGNTEAVR